MEDLLRDPLTVEEGTVRRFEVSKKVTGFACLRVYDRRDLCVASRNPRVIYADIRLKRTAEYHLVAVERDRYREKLPGQEYECRTQISF